MATYEITIRLDLPETKRGKPTARARAIASEWSDQMSFAFERVSCSDELGAVVKDDWYSAYTLEGWVGKAGG